MSASEALLELSRGAIAAETEVAWLLDGDLEIAAVSKAWDRFAAANDAPERVLARNVIGTKWLSHIEGSQPRSLFEKVAHAALELRGRPAISGLRLGGDCNTPVLRRETSTQFLPVLDGETAVGLFVRSSVIAESPIAGTYRVRALSDLHFAEGLISMCSGCRRVRTRDRLWELVPALLEHEPAQVSHGFCDPCASLVYGV